MFGYKKILVSCMLVLALLVSPLAAFADSHTKMNQVRKAAPLEPGVIVADLILVRPLGLVATIAGSVVFIVSVPFAALGGNTEETWESLVVSPAEYTFKRPLGRFEE